MILSQSHQGKLLVLKEGVQYHLMFNTPSARISQTESQILFYIRNLKQSQNLKIWSSSFKIPKFRNQRTILLALDHRFLLVTLWMIGRKGVVKKEGSLVGKALKLYLQIGKSNDASAISSKTVVAKHWESFEVWFKIPKL